MATFYNQATLSYNGTVRNSNIVSGEIAEVLSIAKTALDTTYNAGDTITYVISIYNTGDTPYNNVSVTDNLGRYAFTPGAATLVPLTYEDGTARYYVNGVQQGNPTVTVGDTIVFSGLTVPADSNAMILYEATANEFAPLGTGANINNTATLTAPGLVNPTSAQLQINALQDPNLTINKSVSPQVVDEDGPLTYTFVVRNTGPAAADQGGGIVINDTFNPILENLVVTLNGTQLDPTGYTYDETTGVFSTTGTTITVPAAQYSQDPVTGEWRTDAGTVELTVTGNIRT